jgi:hypothetical protein
MSPTSHRPRRAGRVRLALAAGVVVAAAAGVGLAVGLRPEEPLAAAPTSTTAPPSTPATTVAAPPTTAVSDTSTTTTLPPSTTLVVPAGPVEVVVVGDSLGGVSAAITAGRMGIPTLLLSTTGYLGGQASAAGVPTMDEGANAALFRRSGLYGEMVDHLGAFYGSRTMGGCYFGDTTVCPEPDVIDSFLRDRLSAAGVTVRPVETVTDVLQDGNRVTGVEADGIVYQAEVVIDATEFADLYPLVEGLGFEAGDPAAGCLQDMTWVAIRNWYPGGAPDALVPPPGAIEELRALWGADTVDEWLAGFRQRVALPGPAGDGLTPSTPSAWSPDFEARYRSLADRRPVAAVDGAPEVTRTAVNYANDAPLSAAALDNPAVRKLELRRALHITYAYLWYLRWELGLSEWGVADDLGYERGRRALWDELIPDDLERLLPPIPYVREARRLAAVATLTAADVADQVRNYNRYPDAVMLGSYYTDVHDCPIADGTAAGFGLYEVPLGVFIPETVDGFLPGIVRNAGLDRAAASSLRMQPDEMWGGQVAGIVAALAALGDVPPRRLPAAAVQNMLLQAGLVYFLPAPGS